MILHAWRFQTWQLESLTASRTSSPLGWVQWSEVRAGPQRQLRAENRVSGNSDEMNPLGIFLISRQTIG